MAAENTATYVQATKIILKSSDHAKEFESGSRIHQVEFITTLQHIQNALKLAVDDPKKEYLHNTITLLGSRGSGKTSFLLSIKKWVEQEKKDKESEIDLSQLQVLSIVDPTLIEEKGHVFLNVISLIMDLVEEKLTKEECHPQSENKSTVSRKQWRNSLNKLAAGIPSIDGIGNHNGDSWQDPEFVMDNGLKAVAASQKLFKNFNKFLEQSLEIIDKKAFLLIFDDIDVDASKGWVVLETIRKYFTGARIITLISGDLELYTTVVRQKKWKNFGEEILKYEGTHSDRKDGLKDFNTLVTTLTAQYMLKIMQPQYRIHLNTLLHRKIIKGRLGLIVSLDDKSVEENLEDLYERIFGQYGILNKVQIEVFSTFLLSQPLRSQIQFLLVFESVIKDNGNVSIDNNKLADIFLSNLLEQKVDIAMAANAPKYLNSVILKLLLNKQNLEDLYQLLPTTTNDSLNATLYTLNLLLSNTVKNNNRFVIFDYMIKIGYLRNLTTLLPYRGGSLLHEKLMPSIEDLCDRAGIFHDNILRDITGKIQAYLYGALELETPVSDITPYFIQLKALKSISRQSYTNRLDVVFKPSNTNKAQRILGYIPAFSATFSYKNESRIGYSFYLLLATIGEIIKQYEIVLRDEDEGRKVILLKQLLKELSQLRSYPIVGFVKKQIDVAAIVTTEHLKNLEEEEHSDDISDDDLVKSILRWITSYTSIMPAPHLLGRTVTRSFYAINNIAESATKELPLDELFHRQIIAFMNAVLIEDVRESLDGASSSLNINNTNTDDGVFINNLKAIERRHHDSLDTLGFSRWILSCPLLLAYLRIEQNGELIELLGKYSRIDNERYSVIHYAVSHLLHSVEIRSQVPQDNLHLYNTIEETPDLLKNRKELVLILQNHSIPFEWFVEGGDRGETMRRNNLIRQYISSIFLDDSRTSGRIRAFRKYLADNNIRW